jgi:hypothetical protein
VATCLIIEDGNPCGKYCPTDVSLGSRFQGVDAALASADETRRKAGSENLGTPGRPAMNLTDDADVTSLPLLGWRNAGLCPHISEVDGIYNGAVNLRC